MLKKNDILETAFEKYTIIEQVGEGGNGCVYRVKNEDGKEYAVKVVVKNKLSTEKQQRFKNEINFCEKYSHDNIIKILDHGVVNKGDVLYIFYVMPLFHCNLRTLMKQGIKGADCIDYFLQISKGLAFAHAQGCIHRDIKPENILISNDGKCVICDFGIAHFSAMDKIALVETKETSRLANFSYHAPEQIGVGKGCTQKTDIFALGLILNEMFTGSLPLGEHYKKISDSDNYFSFLDELISKMIAQNPDIRYQSVDDMLMDYEARKQLAERDMQIRHLSQPVPNIQIDDDLYNNLVEIVDVTPKYGELIITLSRSVNSIWERLYYDALSCYTCGDVSYKDFRFYHKEARCEISSLMGYANTNNVLKEILCDFQEAVKVTNQRYRAAIERGVKEKHELELRRRQAEIERINRESALQDQLRKWLK